MKEYKVISLTPTSSSTIKSMDGYIKSCESTLNNLAKQGWKLVCTESISQQEMSNLIVFMERESPDTGFLVKEEKHEIPQAINENAVSFVENPDPISLPKN